MLNLNLENEQTRKLNVKLSPGADYEYTEKNPDLITYDKPTEIVTADRNNFTNEQTPEAKIEFTPTINGHRGDKVTLTSKVKFLPETILTSSKASIDEEAALSFIIDVQTNAQDYDLRAENGHISLEKIDKNSFKLNTISQGTSKIYITAKAAEHKTKTLEIPVNVRDESTRVSCVPEPGEYLMYVGEKRTWQFSHNASTVTTFSSQQNSGKILYHPSNRTFDITCNAVNGRQRFRVETQRTGSVKKDVIIFMTPIDKPPFINFAEEGCYIPNAGGTYETEIFHNIPNLTIKSANSRIATSQYNQPYFNITSHEKGKVSFKFSGFEGKGGLSKDFLVLIDEPCVTFGGKLYPTFEAFSGMDFNMSQAEFRSGAMSYILEEADFYEYNEEKKTIIFHNITKDEKYRIKVIPVVSGERRYDNASYITFVGVDIKKTDIYASHTQLSLAPETSDRFSVITNTENIEVSGYNSEFISVDKLAKEIFITAKKIGDTQITLTAKEMGKLPSSVTVDVSVTNENRRPEAIIDLTNPIKAPVSTRVPVKIQLKNAKDYRFINKRPDVASFDRNASEIIVGPNVTTGTQYPFGWIEFTPVKDGVEGDTIYTQVEAIATPPIDNLTRLEFSTNEPKIYNNGGKGSVEVNVTTDAPDFHYEILDKGIEARREGNKVIFNSIGDFGTFRVKFKAKNIHAGMVENVQILNVLVRAYPQLTIPNATVTIKKCSTQVLEIRKNYPDDDFEVNNINATHVEFNKDALSIRGILASVGTDIILTPVSNDGTRGQPLTITVVIEELPKPRIVVTPEETRIYGRNPNGVLNFQFFDCDTYEVHNERHNVVQFLQNPTRFQRIGSYFTQGTSNERCYLNITPVRSCDGARGDTVRVYAILMRSW